MIPLSVRASKSDHRGDGTTGRAIGKCGNDQPQFLSDNGMSDHLPGIRRINMLLIDGWNFTGHFDRHRLTINSLQRKRNINALFQLSFRHITRRS